MVVLVRPTPKIELCAVVLLELGEQQLQLSNCVTTGNNITHNLIVNGGIGIYNHGDTGEITCNNGTSNVSSSGASMSYGQQLRLGPACDSVQASVREGA